MPTLPARVVKAIGHNLMLRLNEAWARGQMLFKRWLYDLGPDGRAVPSDFYRMEVRVTRNYHFVTHLPGWGLAASQRSRVL